MQIRKAQKNDNALTILELLYNTDPYIYPILMDGGFKYYEHFLIEKGMYHYDNITVAIVDGEIAGLIVAFENNVTIHKMKNNNLEIYYTGLKDSLDDKSLYINNVSVLEKFRGMGIATKLIQFVEEHCSKSKLILDCLAENTKTIHLYEKLGFTVIETSRAFCTDPSKIIMDVRMEKIVK